jgi:hypothetical protein
MGFVMPVRPSARPPARPPVRMGANGRIFANFVGLVFSENLAGKLKFN